MTINVSDIYHNQHSLEACEYKTLNRKVGIRIGVPHFSEGAGCNVSGIEREYPALNTSSAIKMVSVDDLNDKAVKSAENVIFEIDLLIHELTEHKERINSDISKIKSGEVDLEKLAQKRLFENTSAK